MTAVLRLLAALCKPRLTRSNKGILQADSIEVTVPLYKDVEQADRLNRKLPDVKFSAVLQGAIHTVTIDGTVSV